VLKHVKRSQKNPQGGRLSRETPIHISNVMLVDAAGKRSKVGVRKTADGGKERFFRKTGATAGLISPPKSKTKPTTK